MGDSVARDLCPCFLDESHRLLKRQICALLSVIRDTERINSAGANVVDLTFVLLVTN